VIVAYSFVKDQLFAWVITKNKVQMVKLTPTTSSLANWNKQFQQQRVQPGGELKTLLANFYDQLWKPLADNIPSEAEVIIVPDQEIYEIPFGALWDRQKNQFLVQRHISQLASSAAVYFSCQQRDLQIKDSDKKGMLLVANPTFSRKLFPHLPSLPQAEAEARRVIQLLSNAEIPNFKYTLLNGTTATKEAFLDELDNYNIVHFAGHTLENEVYPIYSRMVFARPELSDKKESTRDNEVLYAHEVYQRKLAHTQLVILAACRTATGRNKSGEGTISLARAFLASGVPTVAASLWDINDRATAEFSVAFHKELLAGKDPAQALRRAQLSLLNHPDPQLQSPAFWSAFVIFGGNGLSLIPHNAPPHQ
jgi:CHAT domain-containing protein